MDFLYLRGYGYVPSYKRTKITDDLHKILDARTDNEIVPIGNVKICAVKKSPKS